MLWIEYVATLVSVRFKLAEFDKLLGCLEMTFNVFKNDVMIVKPFGADAILIMLYHETNQSKIKELDRLG